MNVRRAVVAVLVLLAPVLVWLGHRAYAAVTPDPMATHWGFHGVDGTTAAWPYFVAILCASGALGLAAVAVSWLAHSTHAGRMLTSMLAFGAWIATVPYLESLLLARHIRDAHDVPMPWYAVLGGVGIPLVVAATAYWLHGDTAPPLPRGPVPPAMPLADSERVTWIGHAHSRPFQVLSPLLMAAAAVLVPFQAHVSIPLGIVGVALAWTSVIAVRVDQRGLHTLWGPFGWPRTRVGLGNIADAHSERIEPLQWGGWGYRISSRGTAAVLRRGPGLVVERVHGPRYAVTVDGADEGARVLIGLLARERSRS
ncbi:MAG TPA: hypothetical protein VFJ19_10770 [Nocardioidaceae bacterium]|nr:hypothetical protein [Nocardioidaceae bacterium]